MYVYIYIYTRIYVYTCYRHNHTYMHMYVHVGPLNGVMIAYFAHHELTTALTAGGPSSVNPLYF